jgi:predicted ABC-type ATPase
LTVLERPAVVAVAGPNGAGKSTVAPLLLRETLYVTEFVNADTIARGLSGFDPQGAALAAGRIMVHRLRDLARRRVSFAFETTLASRSFVPWLRGLIGRATRFTFFSCGCRAWNWPSVAWRTASGWEDRACRRRRRHHAGLRNFFRLYRPLATTWRVYDNSVRPLPVLVASGRGRETTHVAVPPTWEGIYREHADECY